MLSLQTSHNSATLTEEKTCLLALNANVQYPFVNKGSLIAAISDQVSIALKAEDLKI